MAIHVTSTAFNEGEMMPRKYTCDGESAPPPLAWSEVPGETQSIAVVCEDPDAPQLFTHWLLYNIPGDARSLHEGIRQQSDMQPGVEQGINSAGAHGYAGPCPPNGQTHRYFFRVYALDIKLSLTGKVTRDRLMTEIEGHILAEGELMGRYARATLVR